MTMEINEVKIWDQDIEIPTYPLGFPYKTNNYDFVYYNQVIKPALVGLADPWIS